MILWDQCILSSSGYSFRMNEKRFLSFNREGKASIAHVQDGWRVLCLSNFLNPLRFEVELTGDTITEY